MARLLAWAWVTIELINGIGHPLWTLRQAGYTPGVGTAPVLLVLALYLASQLKYFQATRVFRAGDDGTRWLDSLAR